jgi:alpha-galactosidase
MQKQLDKDVFSRRIWYHYTIPVLLIFVFSSVLVFTTINNVHASTARPQENNGLAQTPLMGWSSWSSIRYNPSEATIKAQAQAMASTLKSYGYSYINQDDYWYLNPGTTVDQYGRWAVDTSRFPDGIAATASYVHSLGLKFGLYLTPGIPVAAVKQNTPIEGTSYHAADIADTSRYEINYNFGDSVMYYIDYSKPGAQAFINSWADELASWGVDFLKLDGVGDWDIPDIQAWSTALKQSGRSIYFSLSNSLDVNNVSIWQQNANGWRIDGDVECYCSTLVTWNSFSTRFNDVPAWVGDGGPGGWNDLDSLDVGNGTKDGLSNDERQTYMTLWAIESAPLSIGDDLTSLDSYGLSLLTNTEVIAVDQSGRQAHPISQASPQQVWFANNGDGSYTVALFNLGSSTATVTVNWSSLGFSGSASVRDLWSHTNLGTVTNSFSATLNSHASRLLKVTPGSAITPTPTPTQTPTPPPSNACSVHYAVTNQWPGGFGVSITITNTGSTTLNGWTLKFTFPGSQQVTQGWNGIFTQSGANVTVTNASYNETLAPGASANPGFNGSWNGSNPNPTAFTLNGASCSVV